MHHETKCCKMFVLKYFFFLIIFIGLIIKKTNIKFRFKSFFSYSLNLPKNIEPETALEFRLANRLAGVNLFGEVCITPEASGRLIYQDTLVNG